MNLRLVWPPETPRRDALEGHPRQLGYRLLRRLFPGARQPHRLVRIQRRATQVITLTVFSIFSVPYLGDRFKWNDGAGFALVAIGSFFIFHKW